MLSPCFTSIPKAGKGLPKTGDSFYWQVRSIQICDDNFDFCKKNMNWYNITVVAETSENVNNSDLLRLY